MSLPIDRRHEQHILSDAEIDEIRSLYNLTKDYDRGDPGRWTYRRLGHHYGVSRQTIHNVVHAVHYDWLK